MIEKFRKVAKNPIMKVIMLLLVVSFMLSGISAGVMSQATDDHILKVAGEKIFPRQVQNEISKIQNAILERNPGLELDENMLARLGVSPQRVLNDMTEQRLLFAEVDDLGLSVSDDLLRREITTSPTFQTEGKFNRDTFQRFLYTQGLREHEYLDQLRQELSANLLLTSLFGSIGLPQNIYDLGKKELSGLYTIEFANVPRGAGEVKKAVTDEELQQYLFVNSQIYKRPELRNVSYIEIAKLEDAAESLAMAETIEDEIAAGSTLQEIAEKRSAKTEEYEYSGVYPDRPANVRAYEIDEGEIDIVEVDDNYVVLQLDSITEERVPELAEVKDLIEDAWREEQVIKATQKLADEYYAEAEKTDKLPAGLKRHTIDAISAQDFAKRISYRLKGGKNLIEAQEGEVFGLFETYPEGYSIAKLVNKGAKELGADELASLSGGAQQNYVNELRSAFMVYLAGKHGVELREPDPIEVEVE